MLNSNLAIKEQGLKDKKGKRRWELLDLSLIEPLVDILQFGAEKYEPNSWQNVEDPENTWYAALMRHMAAWRKGEKIDPESHLPHLAHIMCNAMFLLHNEMKEDKNNGR